MGNFWPLKLLSVPFIHLFFFLMHLQCGSFVQKWLLHVQPILQGLQRHRDGCVIQGIILESWCQERMAINRISLENQSAFPVCWTQRLKRIMKTENYFHFSRDGKINCMQHFRNVSPTSIYMYYSEGFTPFKDHCINNTTCSSFFMDKVDPI